jgi:hypothetical protein
MEKIPFQKSELNIVRLEEDARGAVPVYDFPITRKANTIASIKDRSPLWLNTNIEYTAFAPSIIPDNVAKGSVIEAERSDKHRYGGRDMFGVSWVYMPLLGVSVVKPGGFILTDIKDWRRNIHFPDIDKWDWKRSAADNLEYLAGDRANLLKLVNGCWFERLESFMSLKRACAAVADKNQRRAVKALTHELTTLMMWIVDYACRYYNLDVIQIHDDWGSRKEPYFSEEAARDIYLPEMKRFTKHVHSLGKICDLHVTGNISGQVEVLVEAGFDSLSPMGMNDTVSLYERYGDKLALGVIYDKPFNPLTATDNEKKAAAIDIAERFCRRGKNALFSMYNDAAMTADPVFRAALYEESRKAFAQ